MAGKLQIIQRRTRGIPVPPEISQRRDHRQQRGLQDKGFRGERHQIGADQCARCHGRGQSRLARSTSGQLAAFIRQHPPQLSTAAVKPGYPGAGRKLVGLPAASFSRMFRFLRCGYLCGL